MGARGCIVVVCVGVLAGGCGDDGAGGEVDAGLDPAPTPLGPLAWPAAMDPGVQVSRLVIPSEVRCTALGRDHLAWAAAPTPDAGSQLRVGLDHAITTIDQISEPTCSLGVSAAGTIVYATRYLDLDSWSGFGEVGTGRLVRVPHARAVLAADPGGGMLVVVEDAGFPRQILRLTNQLAVDAAFTPITADAAIGAAVVQVLPDGPTVLTVQLGDMLRRFDARTGAAIAGFAAVDVTATPATMRQLAALPDGGVALVARRDPTTFTIDRFDAAGARAPRLNRSVDASETIFAMAVDGAGKLVAEIVGPPTDGNYLRLDPATGALDPGFGVGGLWTRVAFPLSSCATARVIWGYRADFKGATADGTLLFTGDAQCSADSPHYAIAATVRTRP